jgi:hypothetical protein
MMVLGWRVEERDGCEMTESVLGQGGEQLARVSVSGGSISWHNTNVYASGAQIASSSLWFLFFVLG